MIRNDYLLKAIDSQQQVRVLIANTTGVVEEAHRRHNTSATASAALGRVLTATIMMGTDMKGPQDVVTVRINGNGIGGPIIVTADNQGNGRGFISNPGADLEPRYPGKLAVGELVGKEGYIEVVKDLGLKHPFIGRVPLVSGEIAEDFTQYFMTSEQIPSLVSLGVLVGPGLNIEAAGGLFVQALPGADDAVLAMIEQNVTELGPISSVMKTYDSLENALDLVMKGIGYNIIGEHQLAFRCNCSRERLAVILSSLGEEDIEYIFEQEGKLEAVCNFCQEKYEYTPEEILALKKQKP
ncbi:MAG: Hsp33 family molecular chaperone HslO [Syntrophomonadaceae bacterium]